MNKLFEGFQRASCFRIRGLKLLKTLFPVSFSKLPISIKIIGLFYLLTPIFSYLWTAYATGIPFWEFLTLIRLFPELAILGNLAGFLVGLGILGVRRWGYFLFLGFNLYLVAHGLHLLFREGTTTRYIWNLFITITPFGLNLFFLNREISTPYLTLIPRGFRKKWRIEIPLSGKIKVNPFEILNMRTMDISPTGFLANVEGTIDMGSTVTVQLKLDSDWEAPAELMREVDGNYGFKFLFLPGDRKYKELDKFLSTKMMPRFSTNIPGSITIDNNEEKVEILNISERGFYVSSSKPLNRDTMLIYKFSLYGISFTGKGKISWENSKGNFEKPPGYGVSFEEPNSYGLYKFLLYIYSTFLTIKSRDR